jgi:photosystem II stability/assembly factor-like uncharacterized protein
MRTIPSVCGAALLAGCIAGCGSPASNLVLPPLSAVKLGVHSDTLHVSNSQQFSATAYDLSSQPVRGATFAWSSSNTQVLTVSTGGLATAVGEGSAYVYAAAGGMRDSAHVLTLPAAGGWIVQTSNSSRQLNGVFFQSDGRTGCVVGASGEILTTTDAGTTWVHQTSGTLFNLNAVWFVSALEGWAVGASGTALHTVDGGQTWSPSTTSASEDLLDVKFASPDTGWVVGGNGVVLTTFDPGAASPWLRQHPAVFALNSVAFSGTRDGWAVGASGIIVGTHDRGLTWFTVQPAVTASALLGVSRRSDSLAVAVGAAGTVARSFAGPDSTTWELLSAGAANDLQKVMLVDDLHGWAVGSNGSGIVLATANGGVSWSTQSAPAGSPLRAVFFIDALRGWAVGENGRILHTGSGGN